MIVETLVVGLLQTNDVRTEGQARVSVEQGHLERIRWTSAGGAKVSIQNPESQGRDTFEDNEGLRQAT